MSEQSGKGETARRDKAPRLVVRRATNDDTAGIREMMARAYQELPIYTPDQIRGQITNFPDGQFVAIYDDRIVGYCATFLIDAEQALVPHTWREITGDGYASRHDPDGDWLYGMEVCVDPAMRGMRIGRRLYDARKRLCQSLGLDGVVFGGRLPRLARYVRSGGSPEQYLEEVRTGRRRDPVATFQLANDFEILGLMPGYLPSDAASLGHASLMAWRNPELPHSGRLKVRNWEQDPALRTVRVAVVQYALHAIDTFDDFAAQVRFAVDVAAGYRSDFVVFPEHFTMQLLSMEAEVLPAADAVRRLTEHGEAVRALLKDLAMRRNINIIGGSRLLLTEEGAVHNVCDVCLRDGSVHSQAKLHPTPDERGWWNVQGGRELDVIPTDCGPIGVALCYDVEFPEVPRHLANQGAQLLFVPACTDQRQAFARVRACAAARAIENQCYVAVAGNVGNLTGVGNMDTQYAQSCVLTPCDFMFPPEGIAVDTEANCETVAIAEVRMDALQGARNDGAVRNLSDRRFDLYSVQWHK